MNIRTRRRPREAPATGLGEQLVDSVDHAMQFLRRVTTSSLRKASLRAGSVLTSVQADVHRGAAPAPSKKGALHKLEIERRDVMDEIAKLDLELERMHTTITSGGPADASSARKGERLTAFMEVARQLRENIQEKRMQVARLDRRIARERQLLGIPSDADVALGDPLERPMGDEAVPLDVQRKRSRPPFTDADVHAALRRSKIPDRGERLLLEGATQGLVSPSAEVRRQAMLRIAGRPKPNVALLMLGAEDPDERVRLAALGGLTGQRGSEVIDLFRRFLRDKSAALRLAALRGLASIDEGLLTDADLVATLQDASPAIRRAAAGVLGWRREEGHVPPRVMRALCFTLYDEDEAVRTAAAEALGATRDDRAVLSLIRVVSDPSTTVREAALSSLRAMFGGELDGILGAAAPDEHVAALKIWWRGARVRLRSTRSADERTNVGDTTRDVLATLASLKTETPAPAPARAAPVPAPAARPIAAPPVAAPATPAAPAPAAAAPAPVAAPAPPPPAPAPQAPAEAPPVAEAAPSDPSEESPDETASAGEGESQDFESMFTPSEEAEEGAGESEGEGGADYESLLGGDQS